MQTRTITPTKRKALPVLLLALVALVLTTLFAAYAHPANAQQYSDEQYAPEQGPVTATGVLERTAPHSPDPTPVYALTDEATGTPYELTSGFVDLEPFVGQAVTIEGVPVPGNPPPDAPLFLNVTAIAPVDDPGEGAELSVLGTITDISDSVVLVEAEPSAESGDKGYFTVTDETEISRLVGGDALAPAVFEDLQVGQIVEATYAGAVAESYPTQGNAASITIFEGLTCMLPEGCDDPGPSPDDTATLSFELTVVGEPPTGAAFFGFIPAEGGISAPLSDPDDDGLYTGSVEVDRFGPGPRPVPPGTEPVSLPVQIVQNSGIIKDFGLVRIDGDKTFAATVTFGESGEPTMPNDPDNGGTGNGGSGNGGGTGPGRIKVLPATGGLPLIMGVAGSLLIGGLIARKALG